MRRSELKGIAYDWSWFEDELFPRYTIGQVFVGQIMVEFLDWSGFHEAYFDLYMIDMKHRTCYTSDGRPCCYIGRYRYDRWDCESIGEFKRHIRRLVNEAIIEYDNMFPDRKIIEKAKGSIEHYSV